MILVHKKFRSLEFICMICFAVVLGSLIYVSPDQEYLFANAFYDQKFLFVVMPVFLIGNFFIDSSVKSIQMIRLKHRKHALLFLLMQEMAHLVLIVSAYFLFFMLGAMLKFRSLDTIKFNEIANYYIRWMLVMVLILMWITILRRSGRKKVREFAYILVYCAALIEITVFGKMNEILNCNIYFMFSWYCRDDWISNGILFILNIVFGLFLVKYSSKSDIWD